MKYRKSETNDDAYSKEERWICDRCHTEKIVVKEIPIPTEQAMLVKLLMSLSEKYELKGSTITVGLHEVKATFRFPEENLLEKAGMRDVTRIPPRLAPSKSEARRETMRRVFDE
jgi:hypothetical protein